MFTKFLEKQSLLEKENICSWSLFCDKKNEINTKVCITFSGNFLIQVHLGSRRASIVGFTRSAKGRKCLGHRPRLLNQWPHPKRHRTSLSLKSHRRRGSKSRHRLTQLVASRTRWDRFCFCIQSRFRFRSCSTKKADLHKFIHFHQCNDQMQPSDKRLPVSKQSFYACCSTFYYDYLRTIKKVPSNWFQEEVIQTLELTLWGSREYEILVIWHKGAIWSSRTMVCVLVWLAEFAGTQVEQKSWSNSLLDRNMNRQPLGSHFKMLTIRLYHTPYLVNAFNKQRNASHIEKWQAQEKDSCSYFLKMFSENKTSR